MNRIFDEHDLDEHDYDAIKVRVIEGDVAASLIVLASIEDHLAGMESDEVAVISLQLGECGDFIEPALANLQSWYRDEYPDGVDRAIADAKFSVLSQE